ncbi:MAG: tRNA pseudouridine(38-40) synthase TruA [Candidatus Kapaibacteriales bacterium]
MNFFATISYNGSAYSGWQKQTNSNTIQAEIEDALFRLTGEKTTTIAAGRTDAGVHALAMPITFEISNVKIPIINFAKSLNGNLPKDIAINSILPVSSSLNARFQAKSREYLYRLVTKRDIFRLSTTGYTYHKLDIEKMNEASTAILGLNDFTTYSKNNPDTRNPVCDIEYSNWETVGENEILFKIKADRFIYGMVRSLVGMMIDIGRGKLSVEKLKDNLIAKDRNLSSPLAEASGLYFVTAEYDLYKYTIDH